ncbi:MAG: ribonuclease T [Pseudorhodoplanes sp.]
MSGFGIAARAACAFGLFFSLFTAAAAQDRRQNEPGQFDFYVLALSWSPSFCEAASERAPNRKPSEQCSARPYSFIVHGLWPQYEKGFPEFCQVPAPRLNRGIVSAMLDLMPSPRLIFNEWDKHGTCTGLHPRAYFENVRKARAVMKIPAEYLELNEPLNVAPAAVEEAFIKANPGLKPEAITITCDSRRLSEVRVCMGKDFRFRDCGDNNRRSCRRDSVVMPPLRGG